MFGRNIKERRNALGFGQEQLAQFVGVSVVSIRNWERAHQMPRFSMAHKNALARALQMRPEDMDRLETTPQDKIPFLEEPALHPEIRPLIPIVNYENAKQLLKGVAVSPYSIRDGRIPHKFTTDVKEFAWIIEDDSMKPEYRPGDIVILASGGEVATGDDVLVQMEGTMGFVRRVVSGAGAAFLYAINRDSPDFKQPVLTKLADLVNYPRIVAVFRATTAAITPMQ